MCWCAVKKLLTHSPLLWEAVKREYDLKCHVHIHTGAKLYSCRQCLESFTRLDQVKTHLLISHSEDTWHICDICEMKFDKRNQLKRHSLRHADVKPYVCSDCPKRFYIASELRSHQPVHSVVKLYCCSLCDKSFRHARTVKKHFERCHDAEL